MKKQTSKYIFSFILIVVLAATIIRSATNARAASAGPDSVLA